jgi:hypothetical protein
MLDPVIPRNATHINIIQNLLNPLFVPSSTVKVTKMPVLPTVGLNYDYLAATKDMWSAFAQAKDFWHEKRSFEAKPNIQLSRSLDANGEPIDYSQVNPF